MSMTYKDKFVLSRLKVVAKKTVLEEAKMRDAEALQHLYMYKNKLPVPTDLSFAQSSVPVAASCSTSLGC